MKRRLFLSCNKVTMKEIEENYEKLSEEDQVKLLKILLSKHHEIDHNMRTCDICKVIIDVDHPACVPVQCSFCGNVFDVDDEYENNIEWCDCGYYSCGCTLLETIEHEACPYCNGCNCTFCDDIMLKNSDVQCDNCGIISCGCVDIDISYGGCKICVTQQKYKESSDISDNVSKK